MTRAFLDTSVLLGKVLKTSKNASRVFDDPELEMYTNEYALKEVYRVLKKGFGFSEIHISYAIDYIRETCTILPTPSREEFMKYRLDDMSDAPMVASAVKYRCSLYIDDERTARDTHKYVKVVRIPKDA